MTAKWNATIEERGNGIASAGEYVTENGMLYRITATTGRILTGPAGSPNYMYAVVEPADWDEINDDNEPYCTAVMDEDEDEDETL